MGFPNKYDIKISDSEYMSAGENLKKYGEILDEAIAQYILCLSNIAYNAVPSGKVHDAIVCFIAHLAPIENIAAENGTTFERISTEYYEVIDKKDLWLYEMGGSFTRDFSSAEYQKLIHMLKDDIWHNSFDYDWLNDEEVA